MRIVLTGASGFLGRALAERLRAAGHELVLPLRRPGPNAVAIKPIEAMTAQDWRPLLAGAEAVVHSAAIAHIGPSAPDDAYAAVNRDASARLAQAAAAEGVARFVFVSSIRAQVGATSPAVQDESTPPAPTEPYGRSKLEAETLIADAVPRATILRPALIVGPEPKGNLRTMLRLARLPLPLPFGALDAPQAMVSLEGMAEAVAMALARPEMSGETYCVAEEPHLSLAAIVAALRRGMGRGPGLIAIPPALLTLPLRLAGRTALAVRLTGGLRVDATKLRAAGWRPPVGLPDVLSAIAAGRQGSSRP